MTWDELSEMAEAYIVCSLFTADEELIPPKSGEFDPTPHLPKVSAEMRAEAKAVCEKFYDGNFADLADYPAESAGHDLWYTRNHHGVGFWEADHCDEETGERLTKAAEKLGERYVWANEEGEFHFD